MAGTRLTLLALTFLSTTYTCVLTTPTCTLDYVCICSLSSFLQLYHAIEEGKVEFPDQQLEARIPEFLALRPGVANVEDKQTSLEVRVRDKIVHVPVDDKQRQMAAIARKRLFLSESEAQVLLMLKQWLFCLDGELPSWSDTFEGVSSDVLDKFVVWYWDERLYLIRCLRSLVRLTETHTGQVAQPEARALLEKLQEQSHPSFPSMCVKQVSTLVTTPLPDGLRDNFRDANLAAEQRLRAQLELLDLILLFNYNFSIPDVATCLALLRFVNETKFGRRQADAAFHSTNRSQQLLEAISALSVLVCVESVSLEGVMDPDRLLLPPSPPAPVDEPASGAAALIRSSATLNEALDILGSLDYHSFWAPVCLAYALVLNRVESALDFEEENSPEGTLPQILTELRDVIDPGPGEPAVWTKLASLALAPASGMNSTVHSILHVLQTIPHQNLPSSSQLVYRGVVKSLLLSETELVKAPFISDQADLLASWGRVFGHAPPHGDDLLRESTADLAYQFWVGDSTYETRTSFLNTLIRRWPVLFQPLLTMLTSLTGRHTDPVQGSSSEWESERSRDTISAVFTSFARLGQLALFLPPKRVVGNPYETMTDPETGDVLYRLVQPFRVFGQTTLPAGTMGRSVSDRDAECIIVQWELSRPLSGWRLVRDVLAHLAGLTPRDQVDRLDSLILDTSPAAKEQLILAALELFATLMSQMGNHPPKLLDHLEGKIVPEVDELDEEDLDEIESLPTVHPGAPFESIVLELLHRALSVSPTQYNPALVSAAYAVLTHLVTLRPSHMWLALRPTNLAQGSPHHVPLRAREGIDAESILVESPLLQMCKASGQYSPLLSLLDFQMALLLELVQSHFAAPSELLETKVFVVRRMLFWVVEVVWSDALTWRYKHLEERWAVLGKCVEMFSHILSDPTLSAHAAIHAHGGTRGLRAIAQVVEDAFVVPRTATPSTVPLTAILGCSATLVSDAAAESPAAKFNADLLLRRSWQLAIRVVRRRRAANVDSPPGQVTLGVVEQAVFNPLLVPAHIAPPITASGLLTSISSTRTGNSSDKTQVALALVDSILDIAAPEPAVLLNEAVCAAGEVAQNTRASAPALVGSLGSLSETQCKLFDLTQMAAQARELDALRPDLPACRVAIWNLFSALAAHQPSLAAVLVLGEHPNYAQQLHPTHLDGNATTAGTTTVNRTTASAETIPAPPSAANKDNVGAPAGTSEGKNKPGPSALEAAISLVVAWEESWGESAPFLESVLKFLQALWERAPEHEQAFRPVLDKQELWDALRALISADVADQVDPQEEEYSTHVAARQACQTRALHLLATTLTYPLRPVQSPASVPAKLNGAPTATQPKNVTMLLNLLGDQTLFPSLLTRVVQVEVDCAMLNWMDTGLASFVPSLPLEALRMPVRRDRFDASRSYGESYVWDSLVLQSKLYGYRSPDPGNVRPGDGQDEYGATSVAEGAAACNVAWSVLDAQVLLVRAWHELLGHAIGPLQRTAEPQSGLYTTLSQAWSQVAQHVLDSAQKAESEAVSDESVAASLAIHEHVLRAQLALVATLLEFAWTPKEGGLTSDRAGQLLNHTGLVKQLVVLTRPRLEMSLRILPPSTTARNPTTDLGLGPSLHEALFHMVLLALLRCRALLSSMRANDPQRSAVNVCVDVFAAAAIPALRTAADRAAYLAASSPAKALSNNTAYELALARTEADLNILTALVALLVRPGLGMTPVRVHALAAASGLLPSLVELFQRIPLGGDAGSFRWGEVGRSVLGILLAMAEDELLAEPLLVAGLGPALLNNALTSSLEAGQIRAHTSAGGHACWLTMLHIMAALESSLAERLPTTAHTEFVLTDVCNFVCYYHSQLTAASAALRPAPSAHNAHVGPAGLATFSETPRGGSIVPPLATGTYPPPLNSEPTMRASQPALDETETALHLFGAMARASHTIQYSRAPQAARAVSDVLASAARDAGQLIQFGTYLLLRPGYRGIIFGTLDYGSENASQMPEREKRLAQAAQAAQAQVAEGLLRLVRAAVAFLVDWQGVADLVADPAAQSGAAGHVVPSIIPVRSLLSRYILHASVFDFPRPFRPFHYW